jgi:hypothetical protein
MTTTISEQMGFAPTPAAALTAQQPIGQYLLVIVPRADLLVFLQGRRGPR